MSAANSLRTVIAALIRARLARGWSLARVGRELGVSGQAVGQWEAMSRLPCTENLFRWLEILGFEIAPTESGAFAATIKPEVSHA